MYMDAQIPVGFGVALLASPGMHTETETQAAGVDEKVGVVDSLSSRQPDIRVRFRSDP
jgi:hypothetical protein